GLPTAKPKGKTKLAATPPPSDVDIGPESVVLDWVAGTSEMWAQGLKGPGSGGPGSGRPAAARKKSAPVVEVEDTTATRRAPPVAAGPGRKSGLVGGLIGAAVTAAAFAGLYFGGVLPNGSAPTRQPTTPPQGGQQPRNDTAGQPAAGPTTVADARAALENGDAAARAALFLGLSHETAGDRTAARKVYQDAVKKFPQSAEMFQAALDRLDATEAPGKSSRLTPAEAGQLAVAAILLVQTEGQ